MSQILTITFPIYAALAIGFLVVRQGWFSTGDMRVLGRYVMDIALPALLFNAVASRDVAEVFHPGYMLAFAAAGLGTVALSYLWFTLSGTDATRRAVAVMGSSCPNSGFVGYPVMLLTFPDLAGVILALNMLVENVLIIPACLILMDMARGRGQGGIGQRIAGILWGVLKRPMVIGLLLGLAVSLSGLSMPQTVTRLMQMLAASASALALVVIGGSLAGLSWKGSRWHAVQISALKLLLHPALALLAVMLVAAIGLPLDPDMRTALILSAAMPMFGIYAVLAQEAGHEGMASVALLTATTLAFFTLSGLLYWLT